MDFLELQWTSVILRLKVTVFETNMVSPLADGMCPAWQMELDRSRVANVSIMTLASVIIAVWSQITRIRSFQSCNLRVIIESLLDVSRWRVFPKLKIEMRCPSNKIGSFFFSKFSNVGGLGWVSSTRCTNTVRWTLVLRWYVLYIHTVRRYY